MKDKYPYRVVPLPYPYNDLEPYIDTETMKLHHDKHYQSYVDNLNNTLKDYPSLQEQYLTGLLKDPSLIPLVIRKKVIDNGGGVYNHKLYFNLMQSTKNNQGRFNELNNQFGSTDNFKSIFKNAAMNVFGSGWLWLVKNCDGKLMILSTPNQNTPLPIEVYPVLALDLWEHAYYKKYDNRKGVMIFFLIRLKTL